MADHDLFIEQLSRTIEPVKRPWQPDGGLWRGSLWHCPWALASLLVHGPLPTGLRQAPWVIFQLFLTFITGALAIRNAFC
jgi:hypothetical protein